MSTRKLNSTITDSSNSDLFRRVSERPLLSPTDVPPSDSRLVVIGVLNPSFFSIQRRRYLIVRVDERPSYRYPSGRQERSGKKPLLVAYADLEHAGRVEVIETEIKESFLQDKEPILPQSVREYRLGLRQQELLLSYLSHLRIVELTETGTIISPRPLVCPSDVFTQFGCEDPRVTMLNEKPYLLFSAIGPYGSTSWLTTIRDDNTVGEKKMLIGPDNKHSTLFPAKIRDHYCLLTRPLSRTYLRSGGIWLMRSPDLVYWGRPLPVLLPRPGMWDGVRVGPSTTPILIKEGWLLFYYGVDHEETYRVGVALFNAQNPQNLIARSIDPVLVPSLEWERVGRRADTVFPCGIESVGEDLLRLYYGAADTFVGSADVHLSTLLTTLDGQRL